MRKGTVVNLKGYKFFEFLAKNNILILLVTFFIVGIIIGTFGADKFKTLTDYSESSLKSYISDRFEVSFISIMMESLTSSLLIILLAFVSGASMLGVVLVPCLAVAKGILYGSFTSILYSTYSIKGIAFNAIIVIPSAIVFIIAFLLASCESVKFSVIIAKMTFPKTLPANLYMDFKNYCGKYLIFCVVVLLSAIIDGVLSCSFISYFKL